MSNASRKARKRSGEKFFKSPKEGTPIEDRMVPTVADQKGKNFGPVIQHLSNRVMKRRAAQIAARDA